MIHCPTLLSIENVLVINSVLTFYIEKKFWAAAGSYCIICYADKLSTEVVCNLLKY